MHCSGCRNGCTSESQTIDASKSDYAMAESDYSDDFPVQPGFHDCAEGRIPLGQLANACSNPMLTDLQPACCTTVP